jgi:hypothetical protein
MNRARSLVAEIRSRAGRQPRRPPKPTPRHAPMRHHPDLAWLHQNWELPRDFSQTGQPPPRGIRDWIRWRIARIAWSFLARYMAHSQDFNSHAVRMLDALASRVDAMEEELYAALDELRQTTEELVAYLPLVAPRLPEPKESNGSAPPAEEVSSSTGA